MKWKEGRARIEGTARIEVTAKDVEARIEVTASKDFDERARMAKNAVSRAL